MRSLLLAAAIFGGFATASADIIQTQAQAEDAGMMLTVSQLNAFKDTGKRFAFHTTQRDDWSTFDASNLGVQAIAPVNLFTLTSGSQNGQVWVHNVAGETIVDAGGAKNVTWSADPAAKGFDWVIVQPNDGTAGAYDANKQFRLRNTKGENYRANYRDFSSATGDWARYVAYGPFYIVTVKCESEEPGFVAPQPRQVIVNNGTVSIDAPNLSGYVSSEYTKEVTVSDADVTVTFTYTKGFNPFSLNITPRPAQVTMGGDALPLPAAFTVGGAGLSQSTTSDVEKWVADFNGAAAVGYKATAVATEDAFIRLVLDETLSPDEYGTEGYKLEIYADGVKISAASEGGLYYGLVTLKKMLPASITIGVKDDRFDTYALPCLTINDMPRFSYRGFMLDCSRHFYTVDELKHILNIMAVYKMNRFHWHLTDDQGWRAEIKKYPRLTSVASIAPNSWMVDRLEGAYWTNEPYGPFFYTQDDMREIVKYAAERHITIVPEIEFPGHALACMAAYPEYSCNPSGNHGGLMPYGVSTDVLNVANEGAMQFVKDILTEIMDIFPGELIHIGGDECPDGAWKNNAECKKKMEELGLTSARALQSHFNKDVADFIGERGHRLATWNESIDANGADTELMASTNATVWCWTNAWGNASKAAKMGLDAMLTPWTRGYINRAQSRDFPETFLPGDGSDNVQNVYSIDPMPSGLTPEEQKHIIGIQGTFWCENIGDIDMVEYMALPRLMCMAETGWTEAARKDFADFQDRMRNDTIMLNLGGYHYARHYIDEAPSAQPSEFELTLAKARHILNVPTYTTKAVPGKYSQTTATALAALVAEAETIGETDNTADITARLSEAIAAAEQSMARLLPNHTYRFRNNIERYKGSAIAYSGKGSNLQHSTDAEACSDWMVTVSADNEDGSQNVKLKNVVYTSKFFGNNATQQGRQMWPVLASATGQYVKVTFRPEYGDYCLTIKNKDLVPIAQNMDALAGIITSGNCNIDGNQELPALHVQGAAWLIDEVVAVTLRCEAPDGKLLKECRYVCTIDEHFALTPPVIEGYTYESGMPETSAVAAENVTYTLRYVPDTLDAVKHMEVDTNAATTTVSGANYDLQGRAADEFSHGIIVKGGNKVLVN